MQNKLDKLLNKYWEGKTSLEEERELKRLLRKADSYPELRHFFSGAEHFTVLETQIQNPTRKSLKFSFRAWSGIAAVFVGGILLIGCWVNAEQQRQKEQAYAQVVAAFQLIQHNMTKGSAELEVISEFRHLNTAGQLFNITEAE